MFIKYIVSSFYALLLGWRTTGRLTSVFNVLRAATLFGLAASFGAWPVMSLGDWIPGEYVSARGAGLLKIEREKSKTRFSIFSLGANSHICNLDGEIHAGRAALEDLGGGPCVVRFDARGKDIEVSADGDGCRSYCGMRASFEGMYYTPAPGCASADVARTRKAFKGLYDKRAYAEARQRLAPLLKNCMQTLGWLESGWIRNDLALTQYKLGDSNACRETLGPLVEDAEDSDEGVREKYPPLDADSYLPIVRATRTNLKLCRGTKR